MITTVFFDLDGTLFPMDQEKFVKSYLGRMAKKMAPHGYEPEMLVKSVWMGTGAMVNNDGSATNETVFWNVFDQLFGRDTRVDEPLFEEFYRNEFQAVKDDCGFDPRAAEAIRQIKALGLRTVLATNPLFPPIATQSRVRWAGLEPEDFEFITTYDNSCFCKPNPDYYREILGKLNLKAEECVMVGNDVNEDMVARELGMKVFLLTDCILNKDNKDISQYPCGSFPELLDYIWSL
ncbi:MAG: HAD family hydrolase [Oscillospiraceae bacterium]|nr:HAD family hydrolase [Oscillospiraceae bacterium]